MVAGREHTSVAVKMVNEERAAKHGDVMKGSANRMVATYQLSFNDGSKATSEKAMSRRAGVSKMAQKESATENCASDGPNLCQPQPTQFQNEEETVKFTPKLRDGGGSAKQVPKPKEMLMRAQDEMLALYMQTVGAAGGGASGADYPLDLTLAYMAKPNQSETEQPDRGAPKSPKPSIGMASRSHTSSAREHTTRNADGGSPTEKKHTQERQIKIKQRILRTPPRNQMGHKAKPEQSPQRVLHKAQKPKEKGSDPIEPKNTCQICNCRVYLFKMRCLVCGRLYCKNCVVKGMGPMTEGRKCKRCVGRRVNERYKDRVGKGLTLSKKVKEAETKAALMNILLTVREDS